MATEVKPIKVGDTFKLTIFNLNRVTWSFTDRPFHSFDTLDTRTFFDNFETTFNEATGGLPNAAITCRHDADGQFEGPIVLVFTKATYESNDQGQIIYS
jgi:hypothetical protein